LNDNDKTLFLFSNVDSFPCKKPGYFVYEALHLRETYKNVIVISGIDIFIFFFLASVIVEICYFIIFYEEA